MSYIRDIDNEILIRRASDFGTIDSSKVYVIDGDVDMGTTSIVVPSTGIQIRGLGTVISKLRSTESAYTMFSNASSDSGDIFVSGVDIIVSGAGSQVFNLIDNDGTHNVELNDINFTGCTKIGILTDFRQFLIQRSFMLSCTGGWEFAGTWSGGARISTVLVRNFTGTLFKGITGLTFGSRFLSDANIDIPSGSVGYDFQDESMFTNNAGYELISGQITGAGTLTSGIDESSVKSRWRSNNGIDNTYVGAQWELTTETATGVSSSATYYKASGSTTYINQQWFSNTTDNAFVYDSDEPINAIIQGSIGVTGTNGHNIQLKVRKWDDSAGSYVDIQTLPAHELSGANAASNISVLAYTNLDSPNDRIELWGQNVSNTGDFTIKENSLLSVEERA